MGILRESGLKYCRIGSISTQGPLALGDLHALYSIALVTDFSQRPEYVALSASAGLFDTDVRGFALSPCAAAPRNLAAF